MSFLDNLENNLKALEGRDENDPEKAKRDQQRREAERKAAKLRAPHADTLKHSPFTSELMTQCRTIGHGMRVLAQFTWIGDNLRLDAKAKGKAKRMELIPTAEGIISVLSLDGKETGRAKVDPNADDPAALARRWLAEK
jgi:hypothetical protein